MSSSSEPSYESWGFTTSSPGSRGDCDFESESLLPRHPGRPIYGSATGLSHWLQVTADPVAMPIPGIISWTTHDSRFELEKESIFSESGYLQATTNTRSSDMPVTASAQFPNVSVGGGDNLQVAEYERNISYLSFSEATDKLQVADTSRSINPPYINGVFTTLHPANSDNYFSNDIAASHPTSSEPKSKFDFDDCSCPFAGDSDNSAALCTGTANLNDISAAGLHPPALAPFTGPGPRLDFSPFQFVNFEPPIHPASAFPQSISTRRSRPCPTGFKFGFNTKSLVPIDAPIQKKRQHTSKTTSTGQRELVEDEEPHQEEKTEQEIMAEIKRLKNTLSARRTRKRKVAHLNRLQDELQILQGEVRTLNSMNRKLKEQLSRANRMQSP
ncbi:Ectomycorrhiza-regulated protein [Mycena indigotica]|uniref:Ectomycorrhiza-regulated protein n=1 Tax=Mycena indigotica TaxID=2126181 RepID=A0A8H6SH37_9AGAR|nr:Ectomycorrhiza-regulated protein [Mycena indigotica]KAF7298571.1 Ectomycorrhiza-regulated protein [Mycena indigotica]